MDPQPQRRPPSAKVFWVVWPTLITLALGSLYYVVRHGPLAAKSTVFRWTPEKVETFPVGQLSYPIRVSDRGVVWVQTIKGLSRLENGVWRTFPAAASATPYESFDHDFTLDGEEVWAAGPGSVVHFDGQHWTVYAEIAALHDVASIVAANGQAWTLDHEDNLAHFDGKTWTVSKVELPGVPSSALRAFHSRWLGPRLAAMGEGRLWLIFQGVWRYDGKSWTPVPGTSRDVRMLGVLKGGALYVLSGSEVLGFDAKGAVRFRYDTSKLGTSAMVYGVAGRWPTFVLAYSAGLYRFDGNNWKLERKSQFGMSRLSDVAVAPDQSIWGIGYQLPEKAAYSRAETASLLGTLLLPVIVVVYPLWYRGRKARYQRAAAKQALLHATGELPSDLKRKDDPAWMTAVGVVIMLSAIYGTYWAAKKFWPAAPIWLVPVCFLALHAGSTFVLSLKPRKAMPNDPIHPGGAREIDWAKSWPPILGGLAVIVLLYGRVIARSLHLPYVAAMPGFAMLLGGQFLFQMYDRFRARRVEQQVKRADYAKARKILDGLLAWPPTALWKLTRAETLLYSGKPEEAEPILREMIETYEKTRQRMLALELLGRVLLAQSKYDDARRAFEAVITMAPTRPAAFSGLAETRLLHGIEIGQALENARRARQLQADRERLAPVWADEAWALATLGRSAEAQQALEAGARDIDRRHRPELAGFHWRAGMTLLALEQTSVAMQWFVKAAEIDPEGYYGQLAARCQRRAPAKISV